MTRDISDIDDAEAPIELAARSHVTGEAKRTALRVAKRADDKLSGASVELLVHQREGVEKLTQTVIGIGEGHWTGARIIADEMRVGKTPQAIALDAIIRSAANRKQLKNNCTLVVCPKSVLGTWAQWLERMGVDPSRIFVVDLPLKKKLKVMLDIITEDKRRKDAHPWFVVVNYDCIPTMEKAFVRAGPWLHVIADEAHALKQPKIKRTTSFKRVKAKERTALTGTPADDKPEDFWSILNWCYPRKYSSFWDWARKVLNVCVNRKTGFEYIDGVNHKAMPAFKREIEPFYVRRMFADVAEFMPVVQHETVFVDMGAQQRKLYDRLAKKWIVELENEQGELVDILTPSQVEWLIRAQQLAIGVCKLDEDDRPILVDNPRSPKIDYIETWLADHPGEPLIVAAHWRQVVWRIAERLKGKYKVFTYTGSMNARERDEVRMKFESGHGQVFIGTIGVMRQGIDLSRADTMIVVEREWNPSWGDQLSYRIQNLTVDRPKTIIHLEARNSIDQYRSKKITKKAEDVGYLVNV